MGMIRLVLADDHRVVRMGLESLVGTFEDVELVGTAAGGREAIEICERLQPDVLLLDLSMPDLHGAEVARALTDRGVPTRVVVFTSFSDREAIVRALDAGAVGYLLKDADVTDIHVAILAAARGEAPLDPRAAMALLTRSRRTSQAAELTDRERDVLALLVEGLANKQIARQLGITEKTVKGHLTNLFQRLGVADRTQAAIWAERHGVHRDR